MKAHRRPVRRGVPWHDGARVPPAADQPKLAAAEPRFYPLWLAGNDPRDPQLARWAELESGALEDSRARVAALEEHVDVAGRAVLDVGCQWGATCIALARRGAVPTGVDISEVLMEGARVRAQEQGVTATFERAEAERLPFPDASFDVVLGLNIMEHVADHGRTLSEMLRVVKPGGRVFFDGPNRFAPGWFRRDQHYGLFGVSVLPHRLGELYVTRVRGFPEYLVGVFPVASVIEWRLRRLGAVILDSSRRPAHGRLARAAAFARFNLEGKFFFVATRPAEPLPGRA